MKTQQPRKPLSPQRKLRLQEAEIVVIGDRCKGCGYCIEFCPKKGLGYGNKLNIHGVHPPVVKNDEECVRCGMCEAICPHMAIFLVGRKEKK